MRIEPPTTQGTCKYFAAEKCRVMCLVNRNATILTFLLHICDCFSNDVKKKKSVFHGDSAVPCSEGVTVKMFLSVPPKNRDEMTWNNE